MQSTTKNEFRRFAQLHKILFVKKKNTAHAVQAKDFVGWNRRQNESGVLRGGTFFLGSHPLKVVVITVRTTTFVSRIWNKRYHGSVGALIWFCKIYHGKVVIVRLILLVAFPVAWGKSDTLSVFVKVINLAALRQPLSIFINGSHGQHDMAMGIVSGRMGWQHDFRVDNTFLFPVVFVLLVILGKQILAALVKFALILL